MGNNVPTGSDDALASRTVDRTLEPRRAAYADEVRRLVEASFSLIRENGDLEPRVGAIVRAAGLSNQAFYRHFRSKDELLLTVLDEGVRMLCGYLAHRMAAAETAEEKIRSWLSGMLEQVLDAEAAAATRPFALSRARLADLFPEDVERSEQQLTALLRDAIDAAQRAGELAGADPEQDAETLYTLAMGWMQRKLGKPVPPDRAEAERLIEFAMQGLRGSGRAVSGTS
jgi:AcrR family transcriptional regulator